MSVPGPVLGPCESWIDGADVAACATSDVGTDTSVLDAVAFEASMALYEISGRQFSGLCGPRLVRPCRDRCACWGPSSLGLGPWSWGWLPGAGAGAWGWYSECGDQLGCTPMSRVKLAGYPVREITEVKIDGVVLAAVDGNGNPNYRLDEWTWLTRMDDPGPPAVTRRWPGCQNMSLDDDQPGTFSVSYRYGVDPPQLGRDAAAQLAWQLHLQCAGQACQLPQGVTRITRQGVQIERGLLTNWFDPSQSTGVVSLDLFLRAYYEVRTGRSAAVWSPDVQQYARPEGV